MVVNQVEVAAAFVGVVQRATGGDEPYPYQTRIAVEGLPELLAVPTGAGKTMAAIVPWLFRRRFHPDATVRAATPRRLVFVLPMRVLVEQTHDVVTTWLQRLGLASQVGCHVLLGGEPRTDDWRRAVREDQIIIGTLDMIVSRALNRGYGATRFSWPIDFGLLSSGCHFVYDEVQLMGPALATSRQLHGLRQRLGTIESCTATWMSATIPETDLLTVDAPSISSRIELDHADRAGQLAIRLDATKRVVAIPSPDATRHAVTVADHLRAGHRPGTLSLAVLNTVDRARAVFGQLARSPGDAEIVLLHSRFRPPDRRRQVDAVLAPIDEAGPGRIVVSTQVVEAGVDISAHLLVTEAAPWPSLVQRAGRCNRDGRAADAVLAWIAPPQPAPYEPADVDASIMALEALESELVTPGGMRERDVTVQEVIHPVLRRKDLIDLFDTAPDLSGNDVDVARFIRAADDVDVAVAWRTIGETGPTDHTLPGRDERCPVPVGELRKEVQSNGLLAWRFDHLEGQYIRVRTGAEIRPGAVVVVDASAGLYTPSAGWDPASKVMVVVNESTAPADDDCAFADDPASVTPGAWVPLAEHLSDTAKAATEILGTLPPNACPPGLADAATRAAALHDIGKAHPVFQTAVRKAILPTETVPAPADDEVLAKSGGHGRLDYKPAFFRHEVASALALLGEGQVALQDAAEPDLIVYLVAAHHGRVRLGARAVGDEGRIQGTLLGILDPDELPAVMLSSGELPASVLDRTIFTLGDRGGSPSWTSRALALRDRADLGPFRLGFLEAIVRLADWEASAREQRHRA